MKNKKKGILLSAAALLGFGTVGAAVTTTTLNKNHINNKKNDNELNKKDLSSKTNVDANITNIELDNIGRLESNVSYKWGDNEYVGLVMDCFQTNIDGLNIELYWPNPQIIYNTSLISQIYYVTSSQMNQIKKLYDENQYSSIESIFKSNLTNRYLNGNVKYGPNYDKEFFTIINVNNQPLDMNQIHFSFTSEDGFHGILPFSIDFTYNNKQYRISGLESYELGEQQYLLPGVCLTTSNDFKYFPELLLTTLANDIVAQSPLSELSQSDLLNNENNALSVLKQQIVNRKDEIFSYYENPNFNEVDIQDLKVEHGDNSTSVKVSLKLMDANIGFGDDGQPTKGPMDLSFYIRGLAFKSASLKKQTVKYTDKIFADVFGSSEKAFVVDWASDDTNISIPSRRNAKLKTMFNNNKSLFVDGNPDDFQLEDITVLRKSNPSTPNSKYLRIVYKTKNENGVFPNETITNNNSIVLELKPTQTKFEELETQIRELVNTKRRIPSMSDIKDVVKTFLNSNKNLIPDTYSPSRGADFNVNNVEVDMTKIKPSADHTLLTFESGAIKIGASSNKLVLDQFSVDCSSFITKLKKESIGVFGRFSEYTPDEVVQILNNDVEVTNFWNTVVVSWFKNNNSSIFENYDYGIINKDQLKYVNGSVSKKTSYSIELKFKLMNATILSETGRGQKEFTIELKNLRDIEENSDTTKFKYDGQVVKYDSVDFSALLGDNTYVYAIDWDEQYLETRKNYFNELLADNISFYFENNLVTTTIKDVKMILDKENHLINVTIKYSGADNGSYNTDMVANFKFDLRALPGTPAEDGTGDISGFFDDLRSDIQSWINESKKIPNTNDLASIIANYLNNHKSDLPVSMQKDFSSSDVNVPEDAIDTSSLPDIIIKNDKITITSTNPNLKVPGCTVQLNTTELKVESINATAPIDSYNAQMLLALASDNNLNNQELLAVETWINDNLSNILNGFPTGANADLLSVRPSARAENALTVEILLDKAYTHFGEESKKFTFDITNFSTNPDSIKETKLILPEVINWEDDLFKEIFVNDNGYASDWSSDLQSRKNAIQTWLTNSENINKILQNPVDSIINFNSLSNVSNKQSTLTFTYSGIKDGKFNQSIPAIIKFDLRPNPGEEGSKFFDGLNDDFVKWLDTEKKVPSVEDVKGIVRAYLEKNNDKLPVSMQKTSWDNADISIEADAINISDLPNITIDKDMISISTNAGIVNVPALSGKLGSTIAVDSIVATDPIDNYYAGKLVAMASDGILDDAELIAVNDWIRNNKEKIFKNLVPSTQITLKSVSTVSTESTAINVTVTLSEAIVDDSKQSKDFVFHITGFNNDNNFARTTQKLQSFSWNDESYKSIFQENDKGYTIDWKNNLESYKTHLTNWLTNSENLSLILNNPQNSSITNVVLDLNESNNQVNVSFEFSGINDQGFYATDMQGSFNISLRPTPGTGPDISNPEINPLVGFKDQLEQWINTNHRFPNDNELKGLVVSYLNSIANDLPNSCIPENHEFNESHIILGTIDKSSSEIHIPQGTITTNTTPSLIFPDMDLSVPITMIESSQISVANSELIKYYSPSELVAIFNDNNPNNDQKINNVLTEINNRKTEILKNIPDGAIIKSIKALSLENANLKVDFILSKAYEVTQAVENKEFSVVLTDFDKSNIKQTTLKTNYINIDYQNAEYGELINVGAFWDDWNKNLTAIKQNITSVINNDFSKFFDNASDASLVSDVTIQETATGADVNIVHSGFNANGDYASDLVSVIHFSLKPSPKPDGDNNNPEANVLARFESFLQTKVNDDKYFPDAETLKTYVCEFLNQDGLIPEAWKPNTEFSVENVEIDQTKINTDSNPVRWEKSAIKIQGSNYVNTPDNKIIIPASKNGINVPVPYVSNNTIQADDTISSLKAYELIQDFNDNANNGTEVIKLKNFLENKKQDIFTNLRTASKVLEITNIQATNSSREVKVSIMVSDAGIIKDQNKEFSDIVISGFNVNSSNDTTSLKINTLDATQDKSNNLFYTIFGNEEKGFFADWNDTSFDKATYTNKLSDYIKTNIDTFFNNTKGLVINSISLAPSTNNQFIATINYKGLVAGLYKDNQTAVININLKKTPSSEDFWLNDGIQKVIQTTIDNNGGILPNKNVIENAISDWLNENINNFPNVIIPADGNFSGDVSITIPSISDEGYLTFEPGTIIINSGKVSVGSITVKTKYTTVNELDIAGTIIEKYIPSEIHWLMQNGTGNEYIKNIQDVINQSLDRVFDDLANDATVTSINSSSEPTSNSLKLNVTLSKAYVGNGIVENKSFDIILKGFDTLSSETQLMINQISYYDDNFKNIFKNDNGYVQDWRTNLDSYKATLIQSMKDNKDLFFKNAPKELEISENSFELNGNIVTFNFNFNGYYNGFFDPNINGTILIELRDADSDPALKDIINGISSVVQSWVDENKKLPSSEQEINSLKQKVADYFNDNISQLPNSWKPTNNQNFTIDDLNINLDLIKPNGTNSVIFEPGTITSITGITSNKFEINLNQVKSTKIIKHEVSAVGSELVSLSPNIIENIFNYEISNIADVLSNFLYERKDQFIENYDNWDIEITSVVKRDESSVKLTINFKKATDAFFKETTLTDQEINIVHLMDNSNGQNDTKLKITSLNATTDSGLNKVKQIFGADEKGFAIDWKQLDSLQEKENKLKDMMNRNPNEWFSNIPLGLNNIVIGVEAQSSSTRSNDYVNSSNEVIFNITFKGIKNNNIQNSISKIKLTLRSNPGTSDSENDIFGSKFEEYLDEKINNENNSIAPTDEQLKEWVSEYLNNNKQDLPNVMIPTDNDGNFKPEHVTINPDNKPVSDKIEYIIPNDSVSITIGDNTIKIPETTISLNETLQQKDEDSNWMMWAIIGSVCGLLLIIILILAAYFIKHKKRNGFLSSGFDF